MPIMRMLRDAGAEGPEEAGRGIPMFFTAATAGRKADGKDLSKHPFDFSRGVKAAGGSGVRFPFLWVHDLAGSNLPLGVADVQTAPDELPLRIAVIFDPDDDFAVRVERKYRSETGGLSGVSVSWDEVDADGQVARVSGKPTAAWQLVEVSGVPVGLDADALKDGARVLELAHELAAARILPGSTEAKATALNDAIRESDALPGGAKGVWIVSTFPDRVVVSVWYDDRADNDYFSVPYTEADGSYTFGTPTPVEITYTAIESPKGEPAPAAQPTADAETDDDDADEGRAWPNVATEMVAVFDPECPDDDRVRRRRYNTLTARYRKLSRVPPEFLTAAEIAALGPDEWRGLWLEDEMTGARVGAVLSARNTELLTGARDAIDTVIKSAKASKDDGARGAPVAPEGVRAMDDDLAQALGKIAATIEKIAAAVLPDDEDDDRTEVDESDDDAERAALLAAVRKQLKVVNDD